jgi:outer membrane protein
MKQISYIVNAVLVVAIGILFFLIFSLKSELKDIKTEVKTVKKQEMLEQNQASIAFINIDSLLMNYRLSEDLNYDIKLNQESAQKELEQKMAQFEKDYVAFQEKYQRGGFLTQQRAEEEQQKLVEKQQRLQELEASLSNNLMMKQQQMNQQLYDSISNFLKEFNKDLGFEYILGASQGGGILYANQKRNFTDTVLTTLNNRYLAGKDKE